jgi:hypothetical protein
VYRQLDLGGRLGRDHVDTLLSPSRRRVAIVVVVAQLLMLWSPSWAHRTTVTVTAITGAARTAGVRTTSGLTLSGLDRVWRLRVTDAGWPATTDRTITITFGFEQSTDGGQTWLHAVSAITSPGALGHDGLLPSVGTRRLTPTALTRAFLTTDRASAVGLAFEVERDPVIGRAEGYYIDTGRKNEANATGVGSLNVTLNSTVAGNLLAMGVSAFNNASVVPNSVVTDAGNTWSQSFTRSTSSGTFRLESSVSASVLSAGGNRTITVDPGTSTYDMWINVQEFIGPAATPLSGTPVTNVGTVETTADTTAFTPADAGCLFVAVEGHISDGTITENVAPGDTNWIFSNDQETGAAASPGAMVFYIQTGGPTARRAAWTIPSGAIWTAGVAGFKPAFATGGYILSEISDCINAENSDRLITEDVSAGIGPCAASTTTPERSKMGAGT